MANRETSSPITDFYKKQTIFITGGTGFLGKVLIEKLLWSCPEINAIYVLIRKKYGRSIKERLQDLLFAKVFDRVRQRKPMQFFKVIAIEGEIEKPEFGLNDHDKNLLYENVTVVFHAAASIKFNEPLTKAVNTNLLATKSVIDICKKLKNLKAFIYVSTAYSNSDRNEIDEIVYEPPTNIEALLKVIQNSDETFLQELTPKLLGRHPNTYTLTKALAESLIAKECTCLPVAIVRPAIVCASWKEPFSGWVDNANGPTRIIIAIMLGILRTMCGEPNAAIDVVPVDTVINLLLTVAWKTAVECKNSLLVYNCTSNWVNKICNDDIVKFSENHGRIYQSSKILRYPQCSIGVSRPMHMTKGLFYHYLPACFLDCMSILAGKKSKNISNVIMLHEALQLIEPFIIKEWTFRTGNVVELMNCMSTQDKQNFGFDIADLNWQEYLHTYLLGIQKYFLKEDTTPAKDERNSMLRLYLQEQIFKVSALMTGSVLVWKLWDLFTSCFL